LQEQPDASVRIEGHADARGSRRTNFGLSRRRANAVAAELRRAGVDDTRIAVVWSGERQPARKGSGAAVWAANRRVELQLREEE
jgi:peptidoglycan-associated lipoprotein